MTVNIEIDYETMLAEANQGGIYLFSGAKNIDEMVKLHMDKLGKEVASVLEDKPLVVYNLEGKLVTTPVEPVEPVEEAEEDIDYLPEDIHPEPVEEEVEVVEAEIVDPIDAPVNYNEGYKHDTFTHDMIIGVLDADLDRVSMDLGIPQKIKVNGEMMSSISHESRNDPQPVTVYRGFPIEVEGMEEPYIIVYKTYTGSEIKLFVPEV